MNNQNYQLQCGEGEVVDPRILLQTIIKHKWIVIIMTLGFTAVAVVYIFLVKPIYQGNVLLEIGEAVTTYESNPLDTPEDLKNIVITQEGINASVPIKSNHLLALSYESADRENIRPMLQKVIASILKRHEKKAVLFKGLNAKVRMTQTVGDIVVDDKPVKPKKGVIITVAFVTGLMLSVFLVFFLEFIRNSEQENQS